MQRKTKILLVEDDVNFGSVLKNYLELHDFKVTLSPDGNKGFEDFNSGQFDLCILDIMMPFKDGITLAQEIKSSDNNMPIIFLTAKTLKEDIIKGYKTGADDYITKPFDSEVLLYKIKAILNRSSSSEIQTKNNNEYTIGQFLFNYNTRFIHYKKDSYKLSPKEAALLKLLCAKMNDVLTREEALTYIWKDDNYFTARSMDVFIFKLRKYLKKDEKVSIINLHSNGFMLKVTE